MSKVFSVLVCGCILFRKYENILLFHNMSYQEVV